MGGFSSKEVEYTGYNKLMDEITKSIKIINSIYSSSTSTTMLNSNSIENLNLDFFTPKKVSESYDNSSYFADKTSDYDKININTFNRFLTNELKNELGRDSDEYKIICKYLEGKRLGDILDENSKIIISDADIVNLYKEMHNGEEPNQELIDNIQSHLAAKNMGEYSSTLLDIKIEEIVSNEDGFDAMVYEKDGEYWLANTCADGDTKEDKFLIIYSALYSSIGGDDLYDFISSTIENSDKKIDIPGLGEVSYKDIARAKEVYDSQRKTSYDLLNKYAKKGQINLVGYSMGGGIQLDSYIRYTEDNPEMAKNVHLDLYNPYIGFIEGNSDYTVDGKPLIEGKREKITELVKKYGDNIRIYSNEGDVVTQFNSVLDCFGDRVTYLVADNSIPMTIDEFGGDVMALIVGNAASKSRHGLDTIDIEKTFDKNGYIVTQGTHQTLNQIAGGTASSNAIKTLINDAFSSKIEWLRNSIMETDFGDSNYIKDGLIDVYDNLFEYIKNNIGDLNYSDFIESITPGISKILKEGARKKGGNFSFVVDWIANDALTDDEIEKTLNEYLLSSDAKSKINTILQEMSMDNISTVITSMGEDVYWKALEKYHPNRYWALQTVQNASNWFGETFNNAKNWVSDAWNNTTKWVSDAWNNTTEWVSNAWETTTDWIGDRWNDVCNFFGW